MHFLNHKLSVLLINLRIRLGGGCKVHATKNPPNLPAGAGMQSVLLDAALQCHVCLQVPGVTELQTCL